jgi:hypothetical protein
MGQCGDYGKVIRNSFVRHLAKDLRYFVKLSVARYNRRVL